MENTVELTLEQLRELITTPAEVLKKQEEILKEIKEIKEKLEKPEAPDITAPYSPYQPYTVPSTPLTWPPQVWYSTTAAYQYSGKPEPTAQEKSYEATQTSNTRQILHD